MSFRINVKTYGLAFLSHGAPGSKFGSISHNDSNFVVIGVNIFLHGSPILRIVTVYTQQDATAQGLPDPYFWSNFSSMRRFLLLAWAVLDGSMG